MKSIRTLRPARCLLVGLLCAAMPLIMLRWFENRQVYIPMKQHIQLPSDLGHDFQELWLLTADQTRIHAWFFPPLNRSLNAGGNPDHSAGSGNQSNVILLLHGNAGNISTRFHYYQAFLNLGLGVLAVDYRGFGLSEGRPSESGTYLDAEAALRWLASQQIDPSRVILYGESLGGGVASELASRAHVAGLILQSTFTSIPDVGSELFPFLPVRWLGTIRYDTHAKLPDIHVPVMIMHSRSDRLIGFHHAQRNFAQANDPKLLWELQGSHNDVVDANPNLYLEGMQQFLEMIRKP